MPAARRGRRPGLRTPVVRPATCRADEGPEGATLGGESSGHIICSEISPTGDGLVAAAESHRGDAGTGQPLSELRRVLTKLPQLTGPSRCGREAAGERCPRCPARSPRSNGSLGRAGRVLVRYSGTEAKTAAAGGGADCCRRQAGLTATRTRRPRRPWKSYKVAHPKDYRNRVSIY